MSHPKFDKKYSDTTVDKVISFFYKRFGKKETSTICDVVKDIIQTSCTKRQMNGIVLHLNDFIMWYSKYYEKLPDDNFKSVYIKSVCVMWRERNNAKWDVLKLRNDVRTHLSNLFAALFRSERYRLYPKR